MAKIREGGRVCLRKEPAKAGTVRKLLAKSADVEWDSGVDERISLTKIEARGRGRVVGTVAPVPLDAPSVPFSCQIAATTRARLTALNMSLGQLADKSSVSKSTICRMVRAGGVDQTTVTVRALQRLADALGIHPSEFWDRPDTKPTPVR